ncbi:MAG: winged helix-turn-helix transcriptional regulator [Thermoplasmatota archaeon]
MFKGSAVTLALLVLIGPAGALIGELDETATGMLPDEVRSELENDRRLQLSPKQTQQEGDPQETEPREGDPDPEETGPLSVIPFTPKQALQAVASNLTLIEGLINTAISDVEREVNALQSTLLAETTAENDTTPQSTLTEEPAAKWYQHTAVWVAAAVASSGTIALFWLAGSSAAVTPTAKKPMFSPLFTRFEGQKVLEHPRRAELYGHVAEKPGIRLQDLCDETQLSRTAVTHHLRLLEQQHVIVSKRVGRSRHFYENGGRYAMHQKEAYALLQNERAAEIMKLIRKEPGIIQKGVCESLSLQASIAHWHIKRLHEAGLVDAVKQGRTVQYYASGLA